MVELKQGYNILTEIGGAYGDMLMDTGIYVFMPGETAVFNDAVKESAFLPLSGAMTIAWEKNKVAEHRTSLFDEKPVCLHVPCGTEVRLNAETACEVLIQKTENTRVFAPVFYGREDISEKTLCRGLMQDTAERLLRDIFNYENAPYSNMVMGEVITYPGRWSSFPSHWHRQPEVYFYRFDKPQGFGVSIIGDRANKVTGNSIAAIPGGLVHPQVAAPGYAMYYCWMIRHLDGDPWTERIDEAEHAWLYDKDAGIWNPPQKA